MKQNTSVEQLVKMCIQQKRNAQNDLYDMYKDQMYKVCRRYAKNNDEAQEMLFIGFAEVFKNIHKWKNDGPLGAWIRRVMVNQSIQFIRREVRFSNQTSLDAIYETSDKAYNILDKMAADELMELIDTMPMGYKTVFNLFVIEGYTHSEIAKQLNIAENTSKSQYRKARLHLQKALEEVRKSDLRNENVEYG